MSDNASPIGLNTPDAGGRAPGEILRAAREAQGLSLDHLAATPDATEKIDTAETQRRGTGGGVSAADLLRREGRL